MPPSRAMSMAKGPQLPKMKCSQPHDPICGLGQEGPDPQLCLLGPSCSRHGSCQKATCSRQLWASAQEVFLGRYQKPLGPSVLRRESPGWCSFTRTRLAVGVREAESWGRFSSAGCWEGLVFGELDCEDFEARHKTKVLLSVENGHLPS